MRGFLRTLLTAQQEDHMFQSAVWISGPPACSKSLWVRILKRFVATDRVVEFTKEITNFSSSQFENAQLIVFSDLIIQKQKHLEILKPLIGRDLLTSEVKYEAKVQYFQSKSAFIFTSNYTSNEIASARDDEAFMQKLIHVEFPTYLSIPLQNQTPGIEYKIDDLLPAFIYFLVLLCLGALSSNCCYYVKQQLEDRAPRALHV